MQHQVEAGQRARLRHPLIPMPPEQTERYNLAPNAPQPQQYNRPQVQSPFGQPQTPNYQPPAQPYQQQAAQPWSGGASQPLYNSRPLNREEDAPPVLDVVTIALAVLAFFAVLCLIPLWIQVYLSRFAGG